MQESALEEPYHMAALKSEISSGNPKLNSVIEIPYPLNPRRTELGTLEVLSIPVTKPPHQSFTETVVSYLNLP